MPVSPLDRSPEAAIRQQIDRKTKPPGSLGQLETLALQIALIQQTDKPTLAEPHLLVFAADHGLTAEGVSAFPAAVTHQMVLNFQRGGAAINIFCRQNGLHLVVCDVGVTGTFANAPGVDSFGVATPGLVKLKVRPGTRNCRHEPAMTRAECEAAMDAGRTLVAGAAHRGSNVVGFGEMGIGNTSSAALLMHYATGLPIADCTGRGTGLDDAGLRHKQAVLEAVAQHHAALLTALNADPVDVLAAVGGLEIAAIAGGILEAAERRMVVLVDGFIATAALLIAQKIETNLLDYCVFCHQSAEAGHRLMLHHLSQTIGPVRPLLTLGLRLGEGTGCALAYPLLQAAVAMLTEMATMNQLANE
jgi:nicotinate-nucleotide--dimethylbenzimidazole phosphoribosyltransferase